ncbi:MAG: aryl-sulfate sulfotransferase [Thermodesulfobacteriota bacterium]|nr:aryl-sulfate sulfotransferase [Thermodesulfobacteriota bacterium]
MRALVIIFVLLGLTLTAHAKNYAPKVCKKDKIFPGTVFFTDSSDPQKPLIVEVDKAGKVVWKYRLSRKLVPRGRTPLPLGDATPLANGNILFSVHSKGVFEINRDGKIVWEFRDPGASHDADRLANGNTLYNRGWTKQGEDVVREVAPDGSLVWSWNGLPAFGGERFAAVKKEGWMHVNACERLDDGTTLISIRNFHTVVRVNQAGEVVWSYTFRSRGKVGDLATPEGQTQGSANHEPELTTKETMVVAVRKPHAVYEIDLATGQPIWFWEHPKGLKTIRDCNRLPNGNTLITGANKIVEVAPDGEIVWEIRAPRSRMDKPFHRAIKIGPDGTLYGG